MKMGDFLQLPTEVLSVLFGYVPRGSRVSLLCTCKYVCEAALRFVWQPWKSCVFVRRYFLFGDETRNHVVGGLVHACRYGHVEYYKKWHVYAVDAWDISHIGGFLLRTACEHKQPELAKILLKDERVDVRAVINYCINNLATWDCPDVIGVMMEIRSRELRPEMIDRLLIASIIRRSTKNVEFLLSKMETDNAFVVIYKTFSGIRTLSPEVLSIQHTLEMASSMGNLTIVDIILTYFPTHVNPAENNNHAVKWAAYYGHAKVVERLLKDERADPTVNDNWALRMAEKHVHAEVVEVLQNWKKE